MCTYIGLLVWWSELFMKNLRLGKVGQNDVKFAFYNLTISFTSKRVFSLSFWKSHLIILYFSVTYLINVYINITLLH